LPSVPEVSASGKGSSDIDKERGKKVLREGGGNPSETPNMRPVNAKAREGSGSQGAQVGRECA